MSEMNEHVHTHADGTTHSHGHAGEFTSREELLAMLNYMLEHNRHHTEELHDMGHAVGGAAETMIHEAMALYQQGNEKLAAAIAACREA